GDLVPVPLDHEVDTELVTALLTRFGQEDHIAIERDSQDDAPEGALPSRRGSRYRRDPRSTFPSPRRRHPCAHNQHGLLPAVTFETGHQISPPGSGFEDPRGFPLAPEWTGGIARRW